jgi:hypothetical protein
MEKADMQKVFELGYGDYLNRFNPTDIQHRVAMSIMACKSGKLGLNSSVCDVCEFKDIHYNSCRNRHCPCCQAIRSEIWVDSRKAEVIDAPYFHLVFTIPNELNPLIYANQELLYALLHSCAAETVLSLSAEKKFLGAVPGIVQVLHTWGQKLNYHPHIHMIIAGGGLTKTGQFIRARAKFFIPVKVLGKVFRGKFLEKLNLYYHQGKLIIPGSLKKLKNSYEFKEFIDSLYGKTFIPYIKETFNGFGNAIDYLGRYTHRIAISNARIVDVTDKNVSFKARDYRAGLTTTVTFTHAHFIRCFLMHVLPRGFQKIRYYGFLNNRFKSLNLKIISRLTGKELFKATFKDLSIPELLSTLYGLDISKCPACNEGKLNNCGRSFRKLE